LFRANPLKRLPHPVHSPDISPSDFYLFAKTKGRPSGQDISDEISLLDVVAEILNVISTDEPQRVFRSWIERIEKVTAAERGYASS
jgi:hypothetical protein